MFLSRPVNGTTWGRSAENKHMADWGFAGPQHIQCSNSSLSIVQATLLKHEASSLADRTCHWYGLTKLGMATPTTQRASHLQMHSYNHRTCLALKAWHQLHLSTTA